MLPSLLPSWSAAFPYFFAGHKAPFLQQLHFFSSDVHLVFLAFQRNSANSPKFLLLFGFFPFIFLLARMSQTMFHNSVSLFNLYCFYLLCFFYFRFLYFFTVSRSTSNSFYLFSNKVSSISLWTYFFWLAKNCKIWATIFPGVL